MSQDRKVSEEMLGAFVDRQLDAPDWAAVAAKVAEDEQLREDACQLRAQKEMLRHAYAKLPAPPARRRARLAPRHWLAFAATCLAFAMAGWFGHAEWNRPPLLDAASAYALRGDWHALRGDWGSLRDGKVLVHVSSSGREHLMEAMDEIDDLLREARGTGRPFELEIVANGPGLDLLDATDRAVAVRLEQLRHDHPGVRLVACGQTMQRRLARGEKVELVPGTTVAPTALHEVVERLRSGWVYVRV